jgi:hypothetical protein
LLLGGAKDALVALASSDSLRLAVELSMQDQFGNEWTVTMKTWQNVVAGQHRPTFVLENTMTPFKALGLRQGHSLAICEVDGRLQMRNDIPAPNARTGANLCLKKKGSARLSIAQRTINKSAKKASRVRDFSFFSGYDLYEGK